MTHESQYDNMNGYLRTNGFDRIFAQEDYPKDKVVNSFGVQDDFLYQYALPILTETADEGQPFFAVLLSISNHPPYVIPKDFKTHSSTDEHRIVEFADHALKEFIDEAKQQEWFDNTMSGCSRKKELSKRGAISTILPSAKNCGNMPSPCFKPHNTS